MPLDVKICGVTTPEAIDAAAAAGARYVGLVFYPPSPRSVAPELGWQLARRVPTGVRVVGLFVEPSDDELQDAVSRVPLDMIQLHGNETPGRVAEIRAALSMPVMKAIRVAEAADLEPVADFAAVSDRLLFDAKPPKNVTALPGGNGIPFDWTLLAGRTWPKPWMLSGGLDADNVAEAVRVTGAPAIDVSSGVEDRPGHKDPAKVRAFLAAALAAEAA
ncbi:MAG: phosphoribosylanthranilate isomerase [Alphaproteobacteria bacterium]|jgi:phosphoribosylanthranilate isomerase|nr:phosphoribosylanthranilate isomerase [Alphaproteobacteria bacterium]